jgi:CubicO group peptidase (beta-lactamase class C family)
MLVSCNARVAPVTRVTRGLGAGSGPHRSTAWRHGVAGLLAAVLGALPAAGRASPPEPPGAPGPALAGADLEGFLDGFLGAQLAAYQVPGAVVAVARGGRPVLVRGFGVADLASGRPVSGERTLFRAGSVSKVLTWLAVLQLAEQGGLDLRADVNRYLGAEGVPATFAEPVTLAHLMTHTAGFEDRFFGLFAAGPERLLPLAEYLTRYRPARVRPPGALTAYSNYGAALAGRVIERVSGEPFDDYVRRHLLEPLGLTRSSLRQPLEPGLAADLAAGHDHTLRPRGFEWVQPVPAGGLSTTGADMAALMAALLDPARLARAGVLSEAGARRVLERQFSNEPRVAGWTYGFEEFFTNGQRVLWHLGDTLAFSCALVLIPDHDLGLFVAYNRLAQSQPRADLLRAFMDRYFPAPPAALPAPVPGYRARAPRFAGSYRPTRSNLTTVEKVLKLFKPVTVEARPDGLLRIRGLWVLKDALWVEVAPGLFQSLAGPERVVFQEDAAGRVERMLEGNAPQAAYLRLPWHASHRLHAWLVAASAAGFLGTLALAAMQAACERSQGVRAPRPLRGLRRSVAALSAVFLLYLAGGLATLASLRALAPTIEALAWALVALAWLGTLLALTAVGRMVRAWRRADPGPARALPYLPGVLAGIGFVGFLAYWNLLGPV